MQGSERIKITCNPDGSVRLRIDEATPADCGAYKIFVENPLGNDYSICAVAINRKLAFFEIFWIACLCKINNPFTDKLSCM